MAPHKHASLVLALLMTVNCAASRSAPVFSSTYSVSGSLYLPYSELLEPFDAWYDSDRKRSRIDYFNGMVKSYQLGNEGDFGSSFKIVPVTTDTSTNIPTCFKSGGSDSSPVLAQAIIPDLTEFKLVGTEIKNGYQCEVWREVQLNFNRTSTYTMWIRRQKNGKSPSEAQAIPVRYEMRGYNSLIGSHYDHYYLNYDKFVIGQPSSHVFELPRNLSCEGLNDRDTSHNQNINPMNEFIDRRTDHIDEAWDRYKETHSKSYDDTEHDERKNVFLHNLRFIHSTNRKGLGYNLKVNHLADRTDDELKALRGGRYSSTTSSSALSFPYNSSEILQLASDLPQNFDWRIRGAVTPVKDQATCGSCWSFASVGAMEGAYFLKTGRLIRFSEQALVDCSWGYGNNGCDGGADTQSYQWIIKHGGIPTDQQYGSYLGQDGYCHIDTVNLTAPITGFVNVNSSDDKALRLAVFNHGPVSVFIDASHKSFSFYSSGVYYEPQCKSDEMSLDHVVLVIGFGTLDGEDYWLVKNSWSNHWGDQGYVLMSTRDNNCGVMTIPSYVTM